MIYYYSVHYTTYDINSVRALKSVLYDFLEASSLLGNVSKSCLYVVGVNRQVKEGILDVLQMVEENFPFKYFGVPLCTKKVV